MNIYWPLNNKDSTTLDRNFILKQLKEIRADKILDTGVGHCNLTPSIAKIVQAKEIHATDIEDHSQICQEHNILFKQNNLNNILNYPSNNFDLIISVHTIEHIINTDLYLKEMKRILTPNGYILIETVNLAALHYRLMLLFGFIPNCLAPSNYQITPFKGTHGANPHKSVFTHKALLEVLQKHGFKIIKNRSHTIYPLPTFLGNWICKIWPNIGLYSSLLIQK